MVFLSTPSGFVWEGGRGNEVDILSRPMIVEDFKALCTECQFSPGQRGQSNVLFSTKHSQYTKAKCTKGRRARMASPEALFCIRCAKRDWSGSI